MAISESQPHPARLAKTQSNPSPRLWLLPSRNPSWQCGALSRSPMQERRHHEGGSYAVLQTAAVLQMQNAKHGCSTAIHGSMPSPSHWDSFSTVAHAGAGVWTSSGPYGGYDRALAIDPLTPTRSTPEREAGSSSPPTPAAPGPPQHGPDGTCPSYALAINPATPSTLYAGTEDGVFKSTDSGGTWVAATRA